MNPIDKITDTTFTNSSKGLLTLFCIGLVHTVIGVDLTSTEIAIPWLPSINFPNAERIAYLYWGLVGFAMYRYTLYNLHIIREFYFQALVQFFKSSGSGTKFISKNIFAEKINHQVQVVNDKELEPKIKIQHYVYTGDMEDPTHNGKDSELMADVEFKYTPEYALEEITFDENPSYCYNEMALKNKKIQELWGFKEFFYDDQSSNYKSPQIKSFLLRYKLRFNVFRYYFKIVISSKDAFDLLIPLALNTTLLVVWIISFF